jgi:hypothetical protein
MEERISTDASATTDRIPRCALPCHGEDRPERIWLARERCGGSAGRPAVGERPDNVADKPPEASGPGNPQAKRVLRKSQDFIYNRAFLSGLCTAYSRA